MLLLGRLARGERLPGLDGEPELHPLRRIVGVAARLLAQGVHPVAQRVPVDAEPVGRLAPAATRVEQGRERLEQPGAARRRPEHAVHERLERRARQREEQLERAEVMVGGDGPRDGVERRARLEQAAAETPPGRGAADADPCSGRRIDDGLRGRESVLLGLGADEDGRDDMVVGSENEQTRVWLADIGGTFGPVHLDIDGPAVGAVLDADGDGHFDLFSPGDDVGTKVSVRLGDGQGGFGEPITSASGAGLFLETGDINADGLADLVSHGMGGHFHAHLSLGDGKFEKIDTTAEDTCALCYEPALADLDGDGWVDFAFGPLVPGAGDGLLVHRGDGTGVFPVAVGSQPGLNTRGLEPVDVDFDGLLDLVTLRPAFDDVYVLPNDGQGGFALAPVLHASGVHWPKRLRLADFTGDGILDVFVAGLHPEGILPGDVGAILTGSPSGQYLPEHVFDLSDASESATVGDVDGDGWPDVVTTGFSWRSLVQLNRWGPWNDHGHTLDGAQGKPRQIGSGPLGPNMSVTVELHDGAHLTKAFQVLGLTAARLPFHGGVLVPSPDHVNGPYFTDEEGDLSMGGAMKALPSGATVWMQVWLVDAAGPEGWSASNALSFTRP